MGTLRGGNGDEQPPGGGASDGMPDLPPEWGQIVIPDDVSALDDEAARVRRELRRDARRSRLRRWLRLAGSGNHDTPSLGVPLAIMAIAVVATLISLFAVAWPGAYDGRTPKPDSVTARTRPLTLPDLTLRDGMGVPVRLRDATPAVIVLVDGCECEAYVSDLAMAVDARVNVLVVFTPDPYASASPGASGTAGASPEATFGRDSAAGPSPSMRPPGTLPGPTAAITKPPRRDPSGVRIRTLVDPAGALRAAVPGLPTAGRHGTVLLVSSEQWAVIQVVSTTQPVADLKADLERLSS